MDIESERGSRLAMSPAATFNHGFVLGLLSGLGMGLLGVIAVALWVCP